MSFSKEAICKDFNLTEDQYQEYKSAFDMFSASLRAAAFWASTTANQSYFQKRASSGIYCLLLHLAFLRFFGGPVRAAIFEFRGQVVHSVVDELLAEGGQLVALVVVESRFHR